MSVVAFRDVVRQVGTTYAATPWRKKAVLLLVAVVVYCVMTAVVMPMAMHPSVKYNPRVTFWRYFLSIVWTPGLIIAGWATAPGSTAVSLPIKQSRVGLLYDKYFGLNGKYFTLKVGMLGLTIHSEPRDCHVAPSSPTPSPPISLGAGLAAIHRMPAGIDKIAVPGGIC